jgi:adenine phosphoribosyltransferase
LIRDVPDYPKPGIVFKDITPLLGEPSAFAGAVDAIVAADWGGIDKIVGIEARGFILAAPVALAARVGFVPVRKKGKLPSASFEVSYALEYGEATLEVHQDAFVAGHRVLVVDDVLATGGTAAAALDLVEQAGGTVAGFTVLLELGFLPGRERLAPREVHALLTV